jgi:tellurium resistance protein TerZ
MAINLQKGQKISLAKEAGGAVSRVTMGLGWDTGRTQIDLDASCALLDENNRLIEAISFRQLRSANGSIVHTGDNLTGAGDGDDEQIKVDLDRVDAKVKNIVFTVNSYRGQKFTVVENAFVRIVNDADKKELGRFNLSEKFPTTGLVMARLYRHGGEWKFAAMGEGVDGQTVKDMLGKIQSLLG